MNQKEKQIYTCYLYTCNDPQFLKLKPNMTSRQKIIAATRVGHPDRSDISIIVARDSKHVSRYGFNYATEILTGIEIPIIVATGDNLYGRIDVPYCGKLFIDRYPFDKQNTGRGFFPLLMGDVPDVKYMKEYIEEHKDSDGSYDTYRKQLEEIISNSIKNYNSIKTDEPEEPEVLDIEETVQDVYNDFVRTRRNQN